MIKILNSLPRTPEDCQRVFRNTIGGEKESYKKKIINKGQTEYEKKRREINVQ